MARRHASLAVLGVLGCGRLSFDPVVDGAGGGSGSDGSMVMPDGSSDMIDASDVIDVIDAPPVACLNAIELAVNVGHTASTCQGNDLFDGCGPNATEEIVYRFVVPASGGYEFSARDMQNNVTTSTGRLNASCTGSAQCVGLGQITFTAGQVVYFVLEASSGACATNTFTVTAL